MGLCFENIILANAQNGSGGERSGNGRLVKRHHGDPGRKACWPVWWERNGQSQESFLDWRQGTASERWGYILRQRTLEWRRPGNEDEAVTVDPPSEMGCLQPDPHMQSGLET